MTVDPRLTRIVAVQPYRLVFATISGAHLYGFPSPDSDYDLRGTHILPLKNVVGLQTSDETIEDSRVIEGLEMDIVTHDVKKIFGLLLKKNGYGLFQRLRRRPRPSLVLSAPVRPSWMFVFIRPLGSVWLCITK